MAKRVNNLTLDEDLDILVHDNDWLVRKAVAKQRTTKRLRRISA